eukprot:2451522-Rhodomonas_salina.3
MPCADLTFRATRTSQTSCRPSKHSTRMPKALDPTQPRFLTGGGKPGRAFPSRKGHPCASENHVPQLTHNLGRSSHLHVSFQH